MLFLLISARILAKINFISIISMYDLIPLHSSASRAVKNPSMYPIFRSFWQILSALKHFYMILNLNSLERMARYGPCWGL